MASVRRAGPSAHVLGRPSRRPGRSELNYRVSGEGIIVGAGRSHAPGRKEGGGSQTNRHVAEIPFNLKNARALILISFEGAIFLPGTRFSPLFFILFFAAFFSFGGGRGKGGGCTSRIVGVGSRGGLFRTGI